MREMQNHEKISDEAKSYWRTRGMLEAFVVILAFFVLGLITGAVDVTMKQVVHVP